MGTSQNARYGSRPWAHTRSIPPIHTLIHTLWYCMIHTLDPYPCSIPLSCWRMTDVGPNAAFCPNTASGPGAATTVATTTAASSAPLPPLRAPAQPPLLPPPRLLLLLLPLLVIFLLGAAAAVVASATARAVGAPAAGAGSLPLCASGSWTSPTTY